MEERVRIVAPLLGLGLLSLLLLGVEEVGKEEERMAGRKVERRLKCEVRFVVRVWVNCGVVRDVIGREVMGAAMQFMRIVGWVKNWREWRISCTVVMWGD